MKQADAATGGQGADGQDGGADEWLSIGQGPNHPQ
jgi:hypothetical protein